MSVIKMEARDTGHQASTRPISMCTKEGLSKSPFDQRRHDYVLILRCGARFSRRCTTDWSGVPGASQRDFCIAPNVSSSFRPTRRPAADFFVWEPGCILTSRNTFPGWESTTGARLDLDFDPGTMRGKFSRASECPQLGTAEKGQRFHCNVRLSRHQLASSQYWRLRFLGQPLGANESLFSFKALSSQLMQLRSQSYSKPTILSLVTPSRCGSTHVQLTSTNPALRDPPRTYSLISLFSLYCMSMRYMWTRSFLQSFATHYVHGKLLN